MEDLPTGSQHKQKRYLLFPSHYNFLFLYFFSCDSVASRIFISIAGEIWQKTNQIIYDTIASVRSGVKILTLVTCHSLVSSVSTSFSYHLALQMAQDAPDFIVMTFSPVLDFLEYILEYIIELAFAPPYLAYLV